MNVNKTATPKPISKLESCGRGTSSSIIAGVIVAVVIVTVVIKAWQQEKTREDIKMFKKEFLPYYVVLITASVILLVIYEIYHIEFMLHLAAIPFEILIAVFIVDKLLRKRESSEKRSRTISVAITLFGAEMGRFYDACFHAIKSPLITLSAIANSSIEELKQIRIASDTIEYGSPEEMELAIKECVNIEHIWRSLLESAVAYDIEDMYLNEINVLNFIHDVKVYREGHPDMPFIHFAQQDSLVMSRVKQLLRLATQKFLDYACELKESHPDMLSHFISELDSSSRIREASS